MGKWTGRIKRVDRKELGYNRFLCISNIKKTKCVSKNCQKNVCVWEGSCSVRRSISHAETLVRKIAIIMFQDIRRVAPDLLKNCFCQAICNNETSLMPHSDSPKIRLISIVSKPIKVVVVVIVVFVEKKLGKNVFGPKNPCPKNLRTKSVGSNKNFG